MKKEWMFLDGRWMKAELSFSEKFSPGKIKGKGVFETMRAVEGKIFLLEEHLARLQDGLKIFKVGLPLPLKQMAEVLRQTLFLSDLRDARIRLSVWERNGRRHIFIMVISYEPYPPAKYKKGFTAALSSIRQDQGGAFARVKSLDYKKFLAAHQEALRKGCDEAILLNKKGKLTEASRSNIFFVERGVLKTPALTCGCLDGITRRAVLRLAKEIKIPSKAVSAGLESLQESDEAFLTNSLIGIMPMTFLNGKPIHHGKKGPITERLMKAYRNSLVSSCSFKPLSL
jgi:branched-subunit amino acid aminotransferase/4-amino-4-deoxychorismate lyase